MGSSCCSDVTESNSNNQQSKSPNFGENNPLQSPNALPNHQLQDVKFETKYTQTEITQPTPHFFTEQQNQYHCFNIFNDKYFCWKGFYSSNDK